MPRASTRSAHFGGSPEEVEAAFYEAMQQGHLEQLMACWADEDDIVRLSDDFGRGAPAI